MQSDSLLLTALCTLRSKVAHLDVFALDISDLVLGFWLLCNQLVSLFSFILMSHLIRVVNVCVQLWHPCGRWREGKNFIQSLPLPLSIIQPCVSPLPRVAWKTKPVCLSYNKDQPRWTIRANGRQQSFLRIPLNFIDADTKFFPNTNIYTNEIKENTKNENSMSNLKEGLIRLFTLAHCSALFLHHNYFGNESFSLVSDSSLFSVLLFQWDNRKVNCYSTGFFFYLKGSLHYFIKCCSPRPSVLEVNFAVLVLFQTLNMIEVFDCCDLKFLKTNTKV